MSERFAFGESYSDTDILYRASVDCVETDEEFRWLEKYKETYDKIPVLLCKEGQLYTKIDMLQKRPKVSQWRIKRLQDKKSKIRLRIQGILRELGIMREEHLKDVLVRAKEIEFRRFRLVR